MGPFICIPGSIRTHIWHLKNRLFKLKFLITTKNIPICVLHTSQKIKSLCVKKLVSSRHFKVWHIIQLIIFMNCPQSIRPITLTHDIERKR